MAKKLLLIFIIFLMISGFAFSRERELSNAKNAISLSFSFIGIEASYERIFNSHFSVLADASYMTLVFMEELTASGKARWYPFGRAFYMELGLGYTYGSGIVRFYSDAAVFMFAIIFLPLLPLLDSEYEFGRRTGGLLVQGGMGWKIDIGKRDGFVLPISMGINLKIGEEPDFVPYFRLGLGYAF